MARLIWTPQSVADLEALCEYIARDSEEYARVMARRIVEVVEAIPNYPKAGRVVPEYGAPDIRERLVGSYRIIYRLASGAVEVLTIIHGSRLLAPDGEGE